VRPRSHQRLAVAVKQLAPNGFVHFATVEVFLSWP
jgi:hypothetical protein